MTPTPPTLEAVFTAEVTVGAAIEAGGTAGLRRRIVPILGGAVRGPRLVCEVLTLGADWQLIEEEGAITRLVARYAMRVSDGTVITVVNRALRHGPAAVMARLAAGEAVDPALYYFRGAPSFEAPSGPHRWLSESLFVCSGARAPRAVVIDFYRVA